MWDMSGDPFENELSRLFLKPSGEADPVRLKLQVLERLQQEERRRGVVVTAAAGFGAAIAAGAVAASRFGDAAFALAGKASSELTSASATLWPVNIVTLMAIPMALGLLAVLGARVLKDV